MLYTVGCFYGIGREYTAKLSKTPFTLPLLRSNAIKQIAAAVNSNDWARGPIRDSSNDFQKRDDSAVNPVVLIVAYDKLLVAKLFVFTKAT